MKTKNAINLGIEILLTQKKNHCYFGLIVKNDHLDTIKFKFYHIYNKLL